MGIRTIKDGQGKVWRVWHVVPQSELLRTASPGMAAGWLCFEYDGDKRRLANPPETWRDATEEQLLGMLDRAVPAPKLNPLRDEVDRDVHGGSGDRGSVRGNGADNVARE